MNAKRATKTGKSINITPNDILPERIASIDVMRGIAVLAMVFALAIPPGILSDWMYFAQTPPPAHIHEPGLTGITWVDLILPFFLFSLGIAIPFDLERRKNAKHPFWTQILRILRRTFLIGIVALMFRAINPMLLTASTPIHTSVIGLLGFIALTAVLIRPLPTWNKRFVLSFKITGWIGIGLILGLIRYPDGSGFSFSRANIFLVILMNAYFWSALLSLVSQKKRFLRLGLLGILLAMRLAHPFTDWIQAIWNWTPLPGLYQFEFSQFLFIVIPGTLIGDLFLNRERMNWEMDPFRIHRFHDRILVIGLLSLILIPAVLIGLKYRWVIETTMFAVAILVIAMYVFKRADTAIESFVRQIFIWGAYWLIIGLICEPYEGGIRREDATLSYFLITGSLAHFLLIASIIFTDIFNKHHLFEPIRDNGRNSILAYLGLGYLVLPVLNITGLLPLIIKITPGPWLGTLRAIIYTFLVAVVVRFFTRRNYFLRI
ncbi:MAG: DUF5009 domain-containing protein [Candidatus Marinimicrobia bacterium]|jgi:hypothetical protein|nr:DUF5009 domain-containing protein [Candidatus Neomarinimicrobiota bacterium]MDD5062548.1 DUF5009 domain-containing protein [Candidatus Neomarinimicrobiota bacterium]